MPKDNARPPSPRPSAVSVAVDVVLLALHDGAFAALLTPRREAPFAGQFALPGVLVGPAESLDDAAARALSDKAGLRGVYLEQLYTFGAPGRDPRSRTIAVAYVALVPWERLAAGSGDARLARLSVPWAGEEGGPVDAGVPLAFDHAEILGLAVKRMRGKLEYTPVGYALLPPEFTLADLQAVHETVLGRKLNKDSFRRRMLASGELKPTGRQRTGVDHRPAMLYRRHQEVKE